MKRSKKDLIKQNVYLLMPFVLYAIYKNGYLIYEKKLISIMLIFKPLYFVLISVIIKFVIDIIKNKKFKLELDYNLVYAILISMIMPYEMNLLVYMVLFTACYLITLFIGKYIKFNKVCFIYLVIMLINFLLGVKTFQNPLELNYEFNYSFLDYLFGRGVGGISSTSIILSILVFIYLLTNFYYKKEIPIAINLTFIVLAFIYYIVKNDSTLILNSEVIFASIFISSLGEGSPCSVRMGIIYGILIGIVSFILSIYFNSVMGIYLATFIVSLLFSNIKIRQKSPKDTLAIN